MTSFQHLFSPIRLGDVEVPNRIVSTGHHTYLAAGGPSAELVAYHQMRAKGGAGLIVTEIVSVHPSGNLFSKLLRADRGYLDDFRRLAETVKAEGTRIFAQLFHPGREVMFTSDGMGAVAYSASAVPNERFHVMPREMPETLIHEIVEGFGQAAALMAEAGYDGVEVVGSHGYLPAQFLSPKTNLRSDDWGGDALRRSRFTREVATAIRHAAPDLVVGLRLSGDELDETGMDAAAVKEVAPQIARDFDYLSITAGTSASLGGSVHITAPMGVGNGYTAPTAKAIKSVVDIPIIATGRINQPQVAEEILKGGSADLCGMTRALITDPDMPAKATHGDLESIRACIGCNQSCIGRAHKGLGISCIQHPESGRERLFPSPHLAEVVKKVIVVGGGPGGLKAASVCAKRGHRTELWEAEARLGGQTLLAQHLPGREEFGGIADNLTLEIPSSVNVRFGQRGTRENLVQEAPDAVIVATGARPYMPKIEVTDDTNVLTPWQVLRGATTGRSVVIADWKADWIGIGLAERLARGGASVRLCVNASMIGESLQAYTRNHYVARLYRLGVSMKPHLRLFGADEDSVYFQNTLTGDPVIEDDCDTLIASVGHQPRTELEHALHGVTFKVHVIGDALAARTAEEAVYEGMKAAWAI